MEDAHAAVLDLQAKTSSDEHPKPTDPDKRLAFFGVYDGHGGENVARFAGDCAHRIIAKQAAFAKGDIEQALKDGFLATDRAILEGSIFLFFFFFFFFFESLSFLLSMNGKGRRYAGRRDMRGALPNS